MIFIDEGLFDILFNIPPGPQFILVQFVFGINLYCLASKVYKCHLKARCNLKVCQH